MTVAVSALLLPAELFAANLQELYSAASRDKEESLSLAYKELLVADFSGYRLYDNCVGWGWLYRHGWSVLSLVHLSHASLHKLQRALLLTHWTSCDSLRHLTEQRLAFEEALSRRCCGYRAEQPLSQSEGELLLRFAAAYAPFYRALSSGSYPLLQQLGWHQQEGTTASDAPLLEEAIVLQDLGKPTQSSPSCFRKLLLWFYPFCEAIYRLLARLFGTEAATTLAIFSDEAPSEEVDLGGGQPPPFVTSDSYAAAERYLPLMELEEELEGMIPFEPLARLLFSKPVTQEQEGELQSWFSQLREKKTLLPLLMSGLEQLHSHLIKEQPRIDVYAQPRSFALWLTELSSRGAALLFRAPDPAYLEQWQQLSPGQKVRCNERLLIVADLEVQQEDYCTWRLEGEKRALLYLGTNRWAPLLYDQGETSPIPVAAILEVDLTEGTALVERLERPWESWPWETMADSWSPEQLDVLTSLFNLIRHCCRYGMAPKKLELSDLGFGFGTVGEHLLKSRSNLDWRGEDLFIFEPYLWQLVKSRSDLFRRAIKETGLALHRQAALYRSLAQSCCLDAEPFDKQAVRMRVASWSRDEGFLARALALRESLLEAKSHFSKQGHLEPGAELWAHYCAAGPVSFLAWPTSSTSSSP